MVCIRLIMTLPIVGGMTFKLSMSRRNPECKAKRYQCAAEPLDAETYVYVNDAQSKYNYLQVCPEDKPCCLYVTTKYRSQDECTTMSSA